MMQSGTKSYGCARRFVGSDPGSKYVQAKKLSVTILDEAGFEKLVGIK